MNHNYKVVKYFDTYPDTTWKDKIQTLEEAKQVVIDAQKKYSNKKGYSFYIFDENGIKVS
jgi:deoxycytidylate deaminase